MTHDQIALTVPAKGEYAKTVRMTAAALGSRLGMTYDEVEDVRMAAEEAFVYAVGSTSDGAEITLRFELTDDSLGIEVDLGPNPEDDDEDAIHRAEFATFILDAVSDSYEFVSDEHANRSLRVTRRVGAIDAD